MNISQSAIFWLYVYAFVLGIALGLLYDGFRITRVFLGVHYSRRTADRLLEIRLPFLPPSQRHSEKRILGIVVFLQDLLFCLIVGVSLVLLFYEANYGKIRMPVFFCVAAGFVLYRMTLGKIVILFSEIIAFIIETAFRYAFFFALYPFRMFFNWSKKQICSIIQTTKSNRKKQLRKRYTAIELAKTKQNACGLLPGNLKNAETLKRGKKIVKKHKKAIQLNAVDENFSGGVDRCFDRNIRQ